MGPSRARRLAIESFSMVMSSWSAPRVLALALLSATLAGSGCIDETGETTGEEALEPAPPLELGGPASFEGDDFPGGRQYEFVPLAPGGPVRVELLPYPELDNPYAVILLMRSAGIERPFNIFAIDDPRYPVVDATLTRLDADGQPVEELLAVRDVLVFFAPEAEEDDSAPLQGQLWMMADEVFVEPETLDGAPVRLDLELSTAGREPARVSLELVLDFEALDP